MFACKKRESLSFSVTAKADYKKIGEGGFVQNTNVAGSLCFSSIARNVSRKLFSCHGFKLTESTQLQPLIFTAL